MSETLSIRIDAGTKRRLDALAHRSHRTKSFLAAEAISRYVELEEWQVGEIEAGVDDLNAGRMLEHEKVAQWLESWGTASDPKTP